MELAALVTRDSMIGVSRALAPELVLRTNGFSTQVGIECHLTLQTV